MRLEFLLLGVIVLCVSVVSSNEESHEIRYSNSWAVHVNEDNQDSVNDIAAKHGFINRGQIGHLPGYYLFEKDEDKDRGKRSMENHTETLLADSKINWVEQQRLLERSKRNVISDDNHALRDKRDMAVSIQDPYFKDQWYLQNIGQSSGPAGLDINVLPVWARGYSGKGVVVSILDDGVDHTHPDLVRNYDSYASIDLNTFDEDPMPRSKDPLNCHGTRCAGEIAAEANNGVCGVGVSFNASIGGIRMLDGAITDTIEGMSLSYHSNYIDIYTCCWGPKDDGKRYGKPGTFASKALKIGTEKGRGGKGSIFVWATGNGGLTDDDCNCDGYTTSIYTVSIGAISDHGLSTYYTETCASTIAVTFSGASHREADENEIVTTDLDHKCTKTFKGTSSAAPLASGMLALVLEANPNLTWRDVQHLIVETSQKTSPLDEGWTRNGAGKLFNHKFGFGKLDAMRMIDAALKWKTVPEQRVCRDTIHDVPRNIPSSGSLIISDNTTSCNGSTSLVRKLEQVQVVVSLKHRRRGDLSIILISPSGTRSQLLRTRRNDNSSQGLKDWVFMTVHFWGEDPKGFWSLIVTDNDRNTRERHVTKAKQGDMEDVARVVMDDTLKRGHWDSRVINEYDKPKHAPPRNHTANDHILKNMEDTTGELVKGNKFIELAKRKKNRMKNILAKSSHSEHAQKASKVTKKHHKVKQRKKIHDIINKRKHGKRHKKYGHHFKQHLANKKAHKHKFIGKRKHVTHTHKNTRKHKHVARHVHNPRKSERRHETNPVVHDGKANEGVTKPLMADGSIEIPGASPLEAKLALQALASPLIEKIMGITKSNFLPMKRRHSLVGEVDIKMRVFGNGNHLKRREYTAKSQLNKGSKEANEAQNQQEKMESNQAKTRKLLDASRNQSNNIYVKLLKAINARGQYQSAQIRNESKEQLTDAGPPPMNESIIGNKHNASYYSGSRSYGNVSNESEMKENIDTTNNKGATSHKKTAASEDAPMIFYDDDTKQYVTVSKAGATEKTNPEAVILASEGSSSGNKATGSVSASGSKVMGIRNSTGSKVTGSVSGHGSKVIGIRNSTGNKVTGSEHEYDRKGTEEAGGNVDSEEVSNRLELNEEGSIINNNPIDETYIDEDVDDDDDNKSNFNTTKGPPDDLGSVNVNALTGKREPETGSENTENGRKYNDVKGLNGHDYNPSREMTEDSTGNKGSNQYDRIQEIDDVDPINAKSIGNTKPEQIMTGNDITDTGSDIIENKTRNTETGSGFIRGKNRNTETGSNIRENGNENTVTGSNIIPNGNKNDETRETNDDDEVSSDGPVIYSPGEEQYVKEPYENEDYATEKSSSRYSNTGNEITGNEYDKEKKDKGPPDDLGSVATNEFTGKNGKSIGNTKPQQIMSGNDITDTGSSTKLIGNENTDTGSPIIENKTRNTETGSGFIRNKTRNKKDKGPPDDLGLVATNEFTGKNGSETGSNTSGYGNKVHDDISDVIESSDRPIETANPPSSLSGSGDSRTGSNSSQYENQGDETGSHNPKDGIKADQIGDETTNPLPTLPKKEASGTGSKDDTTIDKATGNGSNNSKKSSPQKQRMGEVSSSLKDKDSSCGKNSDGQNCALRMDGNVMYNPTDDEYLKHHWENTLHIKTNKKKINQTENEKIEDELPINESENEIMGNGNEDDGEKVGSDDEERQNMKTEPSASVEHSSGSGNEMTGGGSGDKEMKGEGNTKNYQRGDFMTRLNDDITNGADDDITGETVTSVQQRHQNSSSASDRIKTNKNTLNTEQSQDIEGSSSGMEPSHGLKRRPSQNEQDSDLESSAFGMEPTQGTKERPSMNTVPLQPPAILLPALEEAPIQSNGAADDEYAPYSDMDLSEIPERRPTLDEDVPKTSEDIDHDIIREPYTRMDPNDEDRGLSNDDSRRDLGSLQNSLRRQVSHLETFQEQDPKSVSFTQRVKQDIHNGNIPDLERLENELKKEMENSSNNDASESLFNGDNSMMDPIPSLEGLHRRVRRGLPKGDESNDYTLKLEESTTNTNNNELEHSGILESWNLVFYGT